jgi:hypothetical protein
MWKSAYILQNSAIIIIIWTRDKLTNIGTNKSLAFQT